MKIAVYHNLHSGGAKRTMCAICERLGQHHHLDLYDLSCSDRTFCNMDTAIQQTYTYTFTPLPELRKPFGRLNYSTRLLDLYRLESLQKKIASHIDTRGYDVVYVHPCQFSQTPAVLCYLKTPSLYHSRESLRIVYEPTIARPYKARAGTKQFLDHLDFIAAIYRRKQAAIDRAGVRRSTLIVTNSYFTRETIYRIYGVNSRVCYHGIDTNIFRPLGLARDGGVVSVGALTPNKGFDVIIQGLGLMPAEVRPALTIISNYQEQNEKAYLGQMAEQLDVQIEFLKLVNDDVLVKAYNRARFVVYAPVLEPFGLVPLEAMACGTPVVGVAEGGVRESVVHEQTGLLAERDPAAFAEAMRRLLTDPSFAAELGRNGREITLRHWTWEKAIERLEKQLVACSKMR